MSQTLKAEIAALSPRWRQILLWSRITVFLLAIISSLVIGTRLLFPTGVSTFDFSAPRSLKNKISNPVTALGSAETGIIPTDSTLTFDSPVVGIFDRVKIMLSLDSPNELAPEYEVKFKKGFRAFFYPIGKPLLLPDGSLIKSETKLYLISKGLARPFLSTNIANNLGINKDYFNSVSPHELAEYPQGESISSTGQIPESLLVTDGDYYYQLNDGFLQPFVSTRSFKSRFPETWAIPISQDLIDQYEKSETSLGFSDGTLLATPDYVGLVSNGELRPFISPEIFEAMNYEWSSVITMDGEELGTHPVGDLIDLKAHHPNGAIIIEKESGIKYQIEDETLRPLETDLIRSIRKGVQTIEASVKNKEIELSCVLSPKSFQTHKYECTAPVDQVNDLPGKAYQFKISFKYPTTLLGLETAFYQPITWSSFKYNLGSLKNQVYLNYNPI